MVDGMDVFDRRLVRLRRERAAADWAAHDFLFREVAERLAERLDDMRRRFPVALELGRRGGALTAAIATRAGIETLFHMGLSESAVHSAGALTVVADEETLPFRDGAFDLIASSLALHWVNDLPGALAQAQRALKPDGLFLAALFGGGTLAELREALMDAEMEEEGGVSPRVSPFADVRDIGALLQRAGFALPVVDVDTITVTFPDALALMKDLRGMGETNAVKARRSGFLRRATLGRAAQIYRDRHGGADGRIPATFRVLFVTAWAPASSQPKALRPGSATARLADALDAREVGTGVGTTPTRRKGE
ncbi:MAG: methyltransferase domain-containing protein [Alphaproteobacteria bacterium]|nr:methyltransferase domain-containing protein [Alphaproteobacteria bacterium]